MSFPTFDAPFACLFDFAHWADTIPEVDKVSVLAHITRQLDTQQQIFGEVSYYAGTYIQHIAPAIAASSIIDAPPITLPPSSPFYPTAFVASLAGGDVSQPLELRYRTVELGPRVDPALAVSGAEPLTETVASANGPARFYATLVAGFVMKSTSERAPTLSSDTM